MPAEPPEPTQGQVFDPEGASGKTVGARLLRAAQRTRVLREQIEAARARHRSVDVALATVERDSEIGGSLLAGALAYRLFVFLLPFAVFLVAGLGLYADVADENAEDLAGEVGLTEIVAEQIGAAASETARWWVLVISLPILAYALGQLFRSFAIVHALAYSGSGRAVKLVPRSIGLFGAAVVAQAVAINAVGALGSDSLVGGVLGSALDVAVVTAVWLGVTSLLPHGSTTVAERLPGAALYGVGTLALYLFNTLLIGWLVEAREDTYGALGVAAALLFSMYLTGRLVVMSAVLNATVAHRSATGSESVNVRR